MGKLPAKWYHSWYHPSVTRSKVLIGKRLDGRGGGIRTPDPLLPKQMRYQTALRPDAVVDCTKRGSGSEWRTGMDSGAECQVNEPCDEEDGHGEYDKDDQPHGCEKEPVAPVVTPRVLEMPGEQRVVAAVGLPCDVERVSQGWPGADDEVGAVVDPQ